jgi:heme exporter protein B
VAQPRAAARHRPVRVVALALFSFAAGADAEILQKGAAGFLVLALLLSSTLALGESFRVEQEDAAIEGLLLLPIDPHALFYGKALGNTLFLSLLGPFSRPPRWCSMLSTRPARARQAGRAVGPRRRRPFRSRHAVRRDDQPGPQPGRAAAVDPLPLVVPVLLRAVKSIDLILNGDPMGQLGSWTALLGAFAAGLLEPRRCALPAAVEES